MDGFPYVSYIKHKMCPLTIHCKGLKYRDVTILAAGFEYLDRRRKMVRAYVVIDRNAPEIATELLQILNEWRNFSTDLHNQIHCG